MIPNDIAIGTKVMVKIHSADLSTHHYESGTVTLIHGPSHLQSERFDVQLSDGTVILEIDPEFMEKK